MQYHYQEGIVPDKKRRILPTLIGLLVFLLLYFALYWAVSNYAPEFINLFKFFEGQ